MNYFKNVTSLNDLKKEYRKLAKKYHPDCNSTDTNQIMKDINRQYKLLFEQLKHTKNTNEDNQSENVYTFMNIINELIKYENINIDIIGSWLWIDGNTYAIKDQLKATGFKWSKNKKKWYYTDNISNKKKKGTLSYNQIVSKYGKKTIKSNTKNKQYIS